jgi:hypothetical protein
MKFHLATTALLFSVSAGVALGQLSSTSSLLSSQTEIVEDATTTTTTTTTTSATEEAASGSDKNSEDKGSGITSSLSLGVPFPPLSSSSVRLRSPKAPRDAVFAEEEENLSSAIMVNDSTTDNLDLFSSLVASSWNLQTSLSGEVSAQDTEAFGSSVSLSKDGKTMVVGAPGDTFGTVELFQLINNKWVQAAKPIPSSKGGDGFGFSVALSKDGKVMIAGAPKDGQIRVFKDQQVGINRKWSVLGVPFQGNGQSNNKQFGYAVDVSNDENKNESRIAMGEPFRTIRGKNNVGAVQTRKLNNVTRRWEVYGSLITGIKAGDRAGTSVSFSRTGKRVAVGFPGANNGKGEVRVYQLSRKGKWFLRGGRNGGDMVGTKFGDNFGVDVKLSYDGNAVAARGFRNAKVFKFDTTAKQWIQKGSEIKQDIGLPKTKPSVDLAKFGGNTLVLGSTNRFKVLVQVYKFQKNNGDNGEWVQVGQKIQSNPKSNGVDVSISNNDRTLVVGIPGNDNRDGRVDIYKQFNFVSEES